MPCILAWHTVNVQDAFPLPIRRYCRWVDGMKNISTGFQKNAIGFLAGLIMMSLLLIIPVSAGEVIGWGSNDFTQLDGIPPGTEFTQVGTGMYHSVALTEDGSIVTWGYNHLGQLNNVPMGNGFTQISVGYLHNLALNPDGSITGWGSDVFNQFDNFPTGNGFVQVEAGPYDSLALTADGSIVAWGRNQGGHLDLVPTENGFTQIAMGESHGLALTADGSIVTWGNNDFGQLENVPTGNGFTQISVGRYHSLALTADGSIVGWGYSGQCQLSGIPTENGFVQVSAGPYHNVALAGNGTIVSWGSNYDGQRDNVPTDGGYMQVSAGMEHNMALKDGSSPMVPPVASITSDSSCNEGSEICFDASGSTNTVAGTTYDWEFGDGESGSGVNVGHTYVQNGDYTVTLTVTNPDSQTDTATASISVVNVDPIIDSYSVPETACVGTPVEAQVHFSDAGQDILTATWEWGDQTGEETRGPFTGSGELDESHIYTAPGEYLISLCITDDDGGSIGGVVQITVTDEPISEPPDDPVNTPEFPTLAVSSMLIVGLVGVLLLVRRRP